MEWVVFLIGVVVGVCLTTWFILGIYLRPTGTLRIDRRNLDKEVYRFDLGENFEQSLRKSRVTLMVDNDADLSQN